MPEELVTLKAVKYVPSFLNYVHDSKQYVICDITYLWNEKKHTYVPILAEPYGDDVEC